MVDLSARFEGFLNAPPGARFAIVSSRFNELVVERLAAGARDGLIRHGVVAAQITEIIVPGARELTPVLARLAKSGKFDAILALGAVIRGGTPHFDYVAGEISRACGSISEQTGVPVIFGVLTTDTIEQAIERAGTKAGNKGYDAAVAAVEMVNLLQRLTSAGL
ncbi:MAG: 6,7-dimethyl-8-ribityllumazine synthase [Polyangiaceae bacterium]|nr:6,7-dimethyl-8-ribityllumazine synthase [Polyangiaceae bacterium]